jgi:hypothetical protein
MRAVVGAVSTIDTYYRLVFFLIPQYCTIGTGFGAKATAYTS